MGRFDLKFRSQRLDQSPYLFHFTKGTIEQAISSMFGIIESEKLVSDQGYICFTASPITALKKFFETKVNRTGLPMYQPLGIAFSRDIMVRDYGARNVIYGDNDELKHIPDSLQWRCQKLEVDAYDFEYLREWRIKGNEFNFSSFPKEHILIIAPTREMLNNFVISHDWEFTPYIDETGNVYENWEEGFTRRYRGLTLFDALSQGDDYKVSGLTVTQLIGEDMVNELFGPVLLFLNQKAKDK